MLTTQLATSRLAELTQRAIADLQAALKLLEPAVRRLDDSEPGYPSGQPSSTGISTDDGPLRSGVIMRDAALKDAADLRKLIGRSTTDARNILDIVHRYGVTRHGHSEGDDERSRACESCGNLRSMDRKVCQRCTRTLFAINDVRRNIGRPPMAQLPQAAVAHLKASTRNVLVADVERWARGR